MNIALPNTPRNVNKLKNTLTSHTMSHSAQFHTISIPLCPKSWWKMKRNITVRLGRKAISVLWSVSTLHQKHMTHHYCPASGAPGNPSGVYFRFFTDDHTTRITTISSRIESTELYSSDAKLIYREEQQPFWNVRGEQSQHGTFVNYSRSRLLLHSNTRAIVEKLYAVSILTL